MPLKTWFQLLVESVDPSPDFFFVLPADTPAMDSAAWMRLYREGGWLFRVIYADADSIPVEVDRTVLDGEYALVAFHVLRLCCAQAS